MKLPVFFSAILGWGAAALSMMIGSLILERFQPRIDWRNVILFNLFWSGFFAVPSCLIAGFLVSQYLPLSSRWWRPARMSLLGAVCGCLVMGLLVGMACAYQKDVSSDGWYLCFFAAAAGAVCSFSLATFKRKLPKLETDTPLP